MVYFEIVDCEHLIRHMLVVEPEKRFTMSQIAKHRWLAETPPLDTGPEQEQQQQQQLLQLNKTVIDHMQQLPGLNQNMILHSLKTNSFDHIYAIYNLLVDKLHQRTINFQSKLCENVLQQQQQQQIRISNKIAERSESFNEHLNETVESSYSNRRESFNENCLRERETGGGKERKRSLNEGQTEDGGSPFVSMPTIPAVYLIGDGENPQPLEKFGEMELDSSETSCSNNGIPFTTISSSSSTTTTTSSGYSSSYGGGDRCLIYRRHTVGPGDPAHEQVLETHYTHQQYQFEQQQQQQLALIQQQQQQQQLQLQLPHTNLPLLAQQNHHLYYGGKDPHLLKPPMVLNAAGGFGRRASDGGANLHVAWASSSPGSHEQLTSMMSNSSSGNASLCSQQQQQQQSVEYNQPALDELADPFAVARYMQCRGSSKRHTMANPEDVVHTLQSGGGGGGSSAAARTRRTGLLTVMERPPGKLYLLR